MGSRRTVGSSMDLINAWSPGIARIISKELANLRNENAKWRLYARELEDTTRPCEHCRALESQLALALRLNEITNQGEAA